MEQTDENIKFIHIDKDDNTGMTGTQLYPEPISGYYKSLYEELKDKCDPINFLNPYDSEKIDIANNIYKQIINYKEDNGEYQLKDLRKEAIEKLGIKFSTGILYNHLRQKCYPKRFTGANYNYDHIELANKLYILILKNADNIEALEEIEKQASGLPDINYTPNTNTEEIIDNNGFYAIFFILSFLVLSVLLYCFLSIN